MTEAVIPIREVLRLLLEADSYPCTGNDDWRVADRMEAEVLRKAATAVPFPDDPPNLAVGWRPYANLASKIPSVKRFTPTA